MIRAIRSFFTSLKASRLLGRAYRLRNAGRMEDALNVARQSLALLREPWVVRHHPTVGSLLLSTVILVEQVASELHHPGAEDRDLADALACLNNLSPSSSVEILGSADWAPYLESRLGIKGQSNAVS